MPETDFENISDGIEVRSLDQKQSNARIEKRDDGQEWLAGYASVFFNANEPESTEFHLFDNYYERFMPGCFDVQARNFDIVSLFNHESSRILGRRSAQTLEIGVDGVGLWYRVLLDDTTTANDLRKNINRRDVTGSSLQFEAKRQRRNVEGERIIREIYAADIKEVGPVTFPAYSGTSVEIARRSLDLMTHAYEAEEVLSQADELLLQMDLDDAMRS